MTAILITTIIGAVCVLVAAGVETIIRKIIKFLRKRRNKDDDEESK